MRNNSIQRRKFAADQDLYTDDARVSLLRKDSRDEEVGVGDGASQPAWAGRVEGLNYQITRVENKVKELDQLHKRHLSRPTLDDTDEEEKTIDKLTQETTSLFSTCGKQLKQLQATTRTLNGRETTLVKNIVVNLATRLQDITGTFRSSQGDYLRKLKSREERSQHYFSTFEGDNDDDGLMLDNGPQSAVGWSKQDVLLLEDNTRFVHKREQEIQNIVQSISDLNVIFKDLAQMVSEQGEVVDRIDYNIENTQIKVDEGLKQLKKAEKYQSKNRKMKCIFCLSTSLIVLLIILVFVKS